MLNQNQTWIDMALPPGIEVVAHNQYGRIVHRIAVSLTDLAKLEQWADEFRANVARVRLATAQAVAPESTKCKHPSERLKQMADGAIFCLDCTQEIK